MKALCILRASTNAQDVSSQREEMLPYILADNHYKWCEEDILWIGDKNISSTLKDNGKISKAYEDLINNCKQTILKEDVKCVYLYAVDRLGRTQSVMHDFKEFCVCHSVQMVFKFNSFRLLNEDGTENVGIELLFSVYVAQAKQYVDDLKMKTKRGKDYLISQGKFVGSVVPFGYFKNEEKYLVPHNEHKELVRIIFEKYASGKYSYHSLFKEMCLEYPTFKKLNYKESIIFTTIKNAKYVDDGFVSKDVFNRCTEVRNNNNCVSDKSSKHWYFGNKLVVCGKCGKHFTAVYGGRCYFYKCVNALTNKCDNKDSISISILDSILWFYGGLYEVDNLANQIQTSKEELQSKIEHNKEKIKSITENRKSFERQLSKLVDLYIQDKISQKDYNKKYADIEREIQRCNDHINLLRHEIDIDLIRIKGYNNDKNDYINRLNDISLNIVVSDDEKVMYDIIHRNISKVEVIVESKKKKYIILYFFNGVSEKLIYYPYNNVFKVYRENGSPVFLDIVEHLGNGKVKIKGKDLKREHLINKSLLHLKV